MMSFCVVPGSCDCVDALVLGRDDVEREQPGGRRVDRHRRVHLVQRDAVEQRRHVAAVRDRHADLADLAARELVARRRSRSASAGRTRSRAPSGPWRDSSGRARWTSSPSNGLRTCASSTACRAQGGDGSWPRIVRGPSICSPRSSGSPSKVRGRGPIAHQPRDAGGPARHEGRRRRRSQAPRAVHSAAADVARGRRGLRRRGARAGQPDDRARQAEPRGADGRDRLRQRAAGALADRLARPRRALRRP